MENQTMSSNSTNSTSIPVEIPEVESKENSPLPPVIQNAPDPVPFRQKRIIFFEGNIGAGKSIGLKTLMKRFPDAVFVLEPVEDWKNVDSHNLLDLMYRDTARNAYMFQSYAFISRIFLLKHALEKGNTIICERSIFTDKEIFVRAMYDQKLITQTEFDVYNRIWAMWLNLCADIFKNDLTFLYIRCSPDKCMEHIAIRDREEERGISLQYIEQLNQLHENIYASDFITRNLPGSRLFILDNNSTFTDYVEKLNSI